MEFRAASAKRMGTQGDDRKSAKAPAARRRLSGSGTLEDGNAPPIRVFIHGIALNARYVYNVTLWI